MGRDERRWFESGEDWRPIPTMASYRELRALLGLEKQRSQALRRLLLYRIDQYLDEMRTLDEGYRIELEERGFV